MFDVPDALPHSLERLHDILGIERVVLVQPSGYGMDNQRHIDAIAELGRPARVITSLGSGVKDSELAQLHDAGVRGVRYAVGHTSGAPLAEMPELAARIAEMGWHVQLHVFSKGANSPLPELETTLAQLPVHVVIDHIGSIHPDAGLNQPGFTALLRLVETGRCWVKLSCGYRISSQPPPYDDVVPFVEALVEARPDRLVWASDWPHVFFKGTMPDTTDLLDQMFTWVPDEQTRNRIFVDNPAALYGF